MRKVLIVGATSAIAQETAKRFAEGGDQLFLAGRSPEKLDALVADLRVRGADKVASLALDLNDFDRHPYLINMASEALGGLDTVLIAHGTLSDQKACEQDFQVALKEYHTNFLSVVSLLTLLANRFEAQGHGCLAVISSVAGDRGRQSNYFYASAKGGLSVFLQGLRNRLASKGVQVLTIKPGFVDTPMTTGFKKGALWVGPNVIAAGISYNPGLNPDERLNADWKYSIRSKTARTKAKLGSAANDHMTTLKQNLQCACSYFQDPRAAYAA